MMKNMNLATIALACAFALSGTFALASTVRHRPSVRTYDLYSEIPLARSGFLYANYRHSRGGTRWNGRSASEWGGGAP